MQITQHEHDQRERKEQGLWKTQSSQNLRCGEWLRSVIRGADDRSFVSRHVLVFTGLLIGVATEDGSFGQERGLVEKALVRAVNLAIESSQEEPGNVVLGLNYGFERLSDLERSRISYDKLLPVLLSAGLFSSDGLRSDFVHGINPDLLSGSRISWPAHSPSFQAIHHISQKPLVTTLGPLARLIALTVNQMHAPWLVKTAMDDIASFSRALEQNWTACRLSEIDSAQESTEYDEHTVGHTLPVLWRLLRSILFATTIILRGMIVSSMNDAALSNDEGRYILAHQASPTNQPAVAPQVATTTLEILHNLSFILTHHTTPSSFSQYNFVNLTSIDILSAYPLATISLLTSIAPQVTPVNPHDRIRLLSFLNTAENLALTLTPAETQIYLLPHALAHLTPTKPTYHLTQPIFESAHSLLLSILIAPQNVDIAAEHLPSYMAHLFTLFPHVIQPRQFRLAIKTLVRVASPPSELAIQQPGLAPTILELVRYRAVTGGDAPDATKTLLLALIDSLPALRPSLLAEWLDWVAEAVRDAIRLDREGREECKARFWEVIAKEMDVERGEVCVRWWGVGGGERVLLGQGLQEEDGPVVSGANSALSRL